MPNVLDELNNQKKFLFAHKEENYYLRIITKAEDMCARHDCTELLREMLNNLEYQKNPLDSSWNAGYEDRIISQNRCPDQHYTYFLLEKEAGELVGIMSGDLYPNNDAYAIEKDGDNPAIHMKNAYFMPGYRGLGFNQMMWQKIVSMFAKRSNGLEKIIGGLSVQSLEAGNLPIFRDFADKAMLFSIVKFKQADKPDAGKRLIVGTNFTSYEQAKICASSYKQSVSKAHDLDIKKTKERKGWRSPSCAQI